MILLLECSRIFKYKLKRERRENASCQEDSKISHSITIVKIEGLRGYVVDLLSWFLYELQEVY
jgi:hypothetical protein